MTKLKLKCGDTFIEKDSASGISFGKIIVLREKRHDNLTNLEHWCVLTVLGNGMVVKSFKSRSSIMNCYERV